jgi:hypothetical protein
VLLAGDAANRRKLVCSCRLPGLFLNIGLPESERLHAPLISIHDNHNLAIETLAKINELQRMSNVAVIIAHGHELVGKMPLFPTSLNGYMAQSMLIQLLNQRRSCKLMGALSRRLLTDTYKS